MRIAYCNGENRAFFPSKSGFVSAVKIKLDGESCRQLSIEVFTMPERHVVYALSDLDVFFKRGCISQEVGEVVM